MRETHGAILTEESVRQMIREEIQRARLVFGGVVNWLERGYPVEKTVKKKK